jgi:hypothetical protein
MVVHGVQACRVPMAANTAALISSSTGGRANGIGIDVILPSDDVRASAAISATHAVTGVNGESAAAIAMRSA